MGAYFVRRDSGDPLYRRVLERYVQMAADAGVVQAMFPEGGLTATGRCALPGSGSSTTCCATTTRPGATWSSCPVGLNYDRVLEDRTQLAELEPGSRGGKADTALGAARFTLRNAWQWLGGTAGTASDTPA